MSPRMGRAAAVRLTRLNSAQLKSAMEKRFGTHFLDPHLIFLSLTRRSGRNRPLFPVACPPPTEKTRAERKERRRGVAVDLWWKWGEKPRVRVRPAPPFICAGLGENRKRNGSFQNKYKRKEKGNYTESSESDSKNSNNPTLFVY